MKAAAIPKMINIGRSPIAKASTSLKCSIKSFPKNKYDVTIADTDAINKGTSETRVRSKLNTSTANIIAAIGALKIADIAPAAAAPKSIILVLEFMWNILAMFDPIAEPVATVGPSSPTDPPKPTVSGAVIIDPHIWKRRITPLRLDIA